MVEAEVESILEEIRERVRAAQESQAVAPVVQNGVEQSPIASGAQQGDSSAEAIALINSYLTTTARAWDRLPPVVSNRSGVSARIELWLKRHFKRATRWYAWEQVNFNAAVHHALRALLPVLSNHDQELRKLRPELNEQFKERLQADVQAMRAQIEAQNNSLNARLSDLVRELREREDRLVGEQRVCFKQLSLETSEAAVLEERTRRKTESLLEELQRRVEQLETRNS
jgi:septum formation inhibitor MinC